MSKTNPLDIPAKTYLQYENNPVDWLTDVMQIFLWSKQREIVNSVFRNTKTVVRAAHAVGKTYVAAAAILAFLYLKMPCKVVTTAPTWYQVTDLLWSELNFLFKAHLATKGFPGVIMRTYLRIMDNWFATGISPKESVSSQGFHQRHILVVFDEAPGVRPDIVDGADSLLSSGDAHQLWIGNPTEPQGHFYDAFRDPSWSKFHVSAFDTPNFTGEKVPEHLKEVLTSATWVADSKNKWGVDSPYYISRVAADFPDSVTNQLISLTLCETAQKREIEHENGEERELGVDVARFGDDLSVIAPKQGKEVYPLEVISKYDTMEVAGRVKRVYDDKRVARVRVDVIGIGAGVVDRLDEQDVNVIGVNSAERAIDANRYLNKRTEMWFTLLDWLRNGGKIPTDDLLVKDLTEIRFKYRSDGRYELEPKDAMKKRLKRSPDRGDAVAIAVYEGLNELTREIVTFSQVHTTENLREDW